MKHNTLVQRDFYLQQLISSQHNQMIKIVTGIRRCGKTFLLFHLFTKYLSENGIDDEHIIRISLDNREQAALRNPDKCLKFITKRLKDSAMHYVLIDEVQMMDEFVDVLNSLLHKENVDVYVTGSNSRFLSKDVATEFRGRGWEIHVYPLSFSEYFSAFDGSKEDCWQQYSLYGGLPQLLAIDDMEDKKRFLKNIVKTLYIKDLIERNNIANKNEFKELLQVIASGIGSLCNPNKLAKTFKSVKNSSLDAKTIASYLDHFDDAFITEKSQRFDIKGKRYIGTLSKYYFCDIGLRNAVLNFRQNEPTHIMENIIYNELRIRGNAVDIGSIEKYEQNQRKQLEVDFVVNKNDKRYYIQSVFAMYDPKKRDQEMHSLRTIPDASKRVIIVRDNIKHYHNEEGFLILSLFDFLLNRDSLDW